MDYWRLFGLFAGDGWFQSGGISIGTKHAKRARTIANAIRNKLHLRPITKKRRFPDGHELYLVSAYSADLERLWRRLLKVKRQKSKTFSFPSGLTAREERSFVAGLFDAEAYQYDWRGKPRIAFEIFNQKASSKVLKRLKADGVPACMSRIKAGGNRIDITGHRAVSQFSCLYDWPCRE